MAAHTHAASVAVCTGCHIRPWRDGAAAWQLPVYYTHQIGLLHALAVLIAPRLRLIYGRRRISSKISNIFLTWEHDRRTFKLGQNNKQVRKVYLYSAFTDGQKVLHRSKIRMVRNNKTKTEDIENPLKYRHWRLDKSQSKHCFLKVPTEAADLQSSRRAFHRIGATRLDHKTSQLGITVQSKQPMFT